MHNNYGCINIEDKSTNLYEKLVQIVVERGCSTQP